MIKFRCDDTPEYDYMDVDCCFGLNSNWLVVAIGSKDSELAVILSEKDTRTLAHYLNNSIWAKDSVERNERVKESNNGD